MQLTDLRLDNLIINYCNAASQEGERLAGKEKKIFSEILERLKAIERNKNFRLAKKDKEISLKLIALYITWCDESLAMLQEAIKNGKLGAKNRWKDRYPPYSPPNRAPNGPPNRAPNAHNITIHNNTLQNKDHNQYDLIKDHIDYDLNKQNQENPKQKDDTALSALASDGARPQGPKINKTMIINFFYTWGKAFGDPKYSPDISDEDKLFIQTKIKDVFDDNVNELEGRLKNLNLDNIEIDSWKDWLSLEAEIPF